jgi:hypothetical protein
MRHGYRTELELGQNRERERFGPHRFGIEIWTPPIWFF